MGVRESTGPNGDNLFLEQRVAPEKAHWNDIIGVHPLLLGTVGTVLDVCHDKKSNWERPTTDGTVRGCSVVQKLMAPETLLNSGEICALPVRCDPVLPTEHQFGKLFTCVRSHSH